jgi:hypothetical protein
MIEFSKKYIKTFLNETDEILNEYNNLAQNKIKIKELFEKLQSNLDLAYKLKDITSKIREFFETLLYGNLTKVIDLVGIFLLIFQLVVGLINIISSILVFFNVKSSFVKYLGHSSWCLSTLSLLIMAVVILIFYALGSGVTNLGSILSNLTENDTSLNSGEGFARCFKQFNLTKIYEENGENSKVLETMDLFTANLYNLYSIDGSFGKFQLANELEYFEMQFNNASTAIEEEGKYSYEESDIILNKITNFKNDLPYMIMNDCPNPTSYQLKKNKKECSLPWISEYKNILEIKNKKACINISSLNQANIQEIFEENLKQCKYTNGKYLHSGYETLYEEIESITSILREYLEMYKEFNDGSYEILIK